MNTCNLSVYQNEKVKFDDLTALNTDLLKTNIGELLDYEPTPKDQPFIALSPQITFWDREDQSYRPSVNVWSCFGPNEMSVIAQHIISGHFVLQLAWEGQTTPEYWVLTPNKAQEKKPKFDIGV